MVPGTAAAAAPPPPPQTAVSIQRPAASAGAATCPSCGAPLARGTVLCTQCGYNFATRQRMVAGRPAPLGKPKDRADGTAWYLTPYPYVGALAVALGIFYFLGKQNPAMMLAFVGIGLLYSLVKSPHSGREPAPDFFRSAFPFTRCTSCSRSTTTTP